MNQMNGLFAFTVREEADEMKPVKLTGKYDPDQQIWIGGSESVAGGGGTIQTKNTWGWSVSQFVTAAFLLDPDVEHNPDKIYIAD